MGTHARLPFVKGFSEHRLARIALAEFVGTFFLVIIIVAAVGNAPAGMVPLAVGFGLMPLVYAFGHISMAHFNPCATIAFFLSGVIDATEAALYLGVEFGAAFCGALTGWVFLANDDIPAMGVRRTGIRSNVEAEFARVFLAELLFTFLLVMVILNVAASRVAAGNGYFGIAIGMTVACAAFVIGPISGAALNPAVSFALQLLRCMAGEDCKALESVWIFFLAHVIASVLATFTFLTMHGEACGGGCDPGTCGPNGERPEPKPHDTDADGESSGTKNEPHSSA